MGRRGLATAPDLRILRPATTVAAARLAAAVLAMMLVAATAAQPAMAAEPAPGAAAVSDAIAEHRGGTLRLLSRAALGTVDPQVAYTAQAWQVFAVAYDGLLAFRKVAGAAGRDIVPDLAEEMPAPEEGGRLWRFRLRRGVRFSDGREVAPGDVAASFHRLFRVLSPTAGTLYGGIVGADACLRDPASCTLPGVEADEAAGTVSIRLVRPDREFPLKLALPHASVLPRDAPDRDAGTAPLPGTGPYRIAEYDPAVRMRLERNPHFREWSRDAQPDGYPDAMTYEFGLEDGAEVGKILRGQADWMFDAPPADRLGELGARYAGQVRLNPATALWFLALNVHEPPFDDPRARRAVALAVDRRAVAKLAGGRNLAQPACRLIPPDLPGWEPGCPTGTSAGPAADSPPDLDAARRLVADSGTAGQRVALVVDDSAVQRAIGTQLLTALRDLGWDARLRVLSASVQPTHIQNSANRVQASLTSWYADYPSPVNLLTTVFTCAAYRPGSDLSPNLTGFCDPALDAQMQAVLDQADTDEAARGWAAVDRALLAQAPVVPLFVPRYIDVLSTRVGNYIYNPQFHFLLSQAWVR